MRLKFNLRNLTGIVDVSVVPNEDPERLGCRSTGKGFPVCTAQVQYEGRGYAAMLGWIQLVHSSDNASGGAGFEIDPYEPLGATAHPYCWFGLAPTLFDAPSRPTLASIDWIAHSFLSFIGEQREARAILGFSWGFTINDGEISIAPPTALGASSWNQHLPLLQRERPSWRFARGYHSS